jgi:hypothetical protein
MRPLSAGWTRRSRNAPARLTSPLPASRYDHWTLAWKTARSPRAIVIAVTAALLEHNVALRTT